MISRQNLLSMASAETSPVPAAKQEAFFNEFMHEPDAEWCDVRFGCVAKMHGLTLEKLEGMHGSPMDHFDEERAILAKSASADMLTLHPIRDDAHMAASALACKAG